MVDRKFLERYARRLKSEGRDLKHLVAAVKASFMWERPPGPTSSAAAWSCWPCTWEPPRPLW